jgi:hypothetical protein
VQGDALRQYQVTDLGGGEPGHLQQAVRDRCRRAARSGHRRAQGERYRGADGDRELAAALDKRSSRAVGDELALADDDEVVGGVFHLAHQVAGDEHGAAFGGEPRPMPSD